MDARRNRSWIPRVVGLVSGLQVVCPPLHDPRSFDAWKQECDGHRISGSVSKWRINGCYFGTLPMVVWDERPAWLRACTEKGVKWSFNYWNTLKMICWISGFISSFPSSSNVCDDPGLKGKFKQMRTLVCRRNTATSRSHERVSSCCPIWSYTIWIHMIYKISYLTYSYIIYNSRAGFLFSFFQFQKTHVFW